MSRRGGLWAQLQCMDKPQTHSTAAQPRPRRIGIAQDQKPDSFRMLPTFSTRLQEVILWPWRPARRTLPSSPSAASGGGADCYPQPWGRPSLRHAKMAAPSLSAHAHTHTHSHISRPSPVPPFGPTPDGSRNRRPDTRPRLSATGRPGACCYPSFRPSATMRAPFCSRFPLESARSRSSWRQHVAMMATCRHHGVRGSRLRDRKWKRKRREKKKSSLKVPQHAIPVRPRPRPRARAKIRAAIDSFRQLSPSPHLPPAPWVREHNLQDA